MLAEQEKNPRLKTHSSGGVSAVDACRSWLRAHETTGDLVAIFWGVIEVTEKEAAAEGAAAWRRQYWNVTGLKRVLSNEALAEGASPTLAWHSTLVDSTEVGGWWLPHPP